MWRLTATCWTYNRHLPPSIVTTRKPLFHAWGSQHHGCGDRLYLARLDSHSSSQDDLRLTRFTKVSFPSESYFQISKIQKWSQYDALIVLAPLLIPLNESSPLPPSYETRLFFLLVCHYSDSNWRGNFSRAFACYRSRK